MDQATGFLRPELLWLALAAPALLVLALVSDAARRRALALFAGRGARHVARSAARRRAKIALGVAAIALTAIAAAGPYIDQRERDVRHRGVDIVVAVDTSQSMAVRDVRDGDRLHLARQAVESLGARLTGSRIALVLFANEGVVRYPATTDPELLGQVLDHSARGFRLPAGSSLRAGLAAALTGFPDAVRNTPGAKAVVVISDGEYPADDVPDLAPYLERGIKIFSIGVGTTEGGRIPLYDNDGRPTGFVGGAGTPAISRLVEAPLRNAAGATGGRYWQHTGQDGVIGEAVQSLRALDSSEIVEDGGTIPDDRYQLILGVAIALLLLEWLLDDRVTMPAPRSARPMPRQRRRLRLPSPPRWVRVGSLALVAVIGASCTDALAEQNQAANTLFSRGDYRGALARYRDIQASRPDLLQLNVNAGNALYRMQEHSRALSDYEIAAPAEDAKVRLNAHYGRGSALFRMGRLDEAREAFKDALRADPNDRDSKFNIEVIDRMTSQPQGQQGPGQPGPSASGPPSQGQPGGPGQSAPPGASQAPGQPGASAAPSGAPGGQGQPGGAPPVTLEQALLEFRRDLTPADAFRLLDALMREQGGLEGLLEGRPRDGDPQQPY